jgi:hypothetical protein
MRNQAIRDDKDKIVAFEDYLKSASAADDWYRLLTAAQKINWPTFETAFRTRFPSIEKAVKTSAELQRELQEAKLNVNELGKTELVGGTEVYMHVAFAGKLLQLAQRAQIDATDTAIWAARDNLPDILKEKVSESQTDWRVFCTAIKAVQLSHIRDGVAKLNKQLACDRDLTTRLARLESLQKTSPTPSSIAALQSQFANASLSGPNPQPAPARGSGQGTPFSRPQRSQAEKDEFLANTKHIPQHPDTPAGHAAYASQVSAWNRQHGKYQHVTELTGYPLTLGTV